MLRAEPWQDLVECERRQQEALQHYETLAPGRLAPTPWAQLAAALLPKEPSDRREAWCEGFVAILAAQAQHFPDTRFWDTDYLAASLLHETRTAADLRDLCRRIVDLQGCFGRRSAIAFRYTHDFTYGFDWARWVLKAPAERALFGPFSPTFVGYLERRGQELLTLIAEDDEKYPRLPGGEPRNPFAFSREPEDETALLRALRDAGELPLQAWRIDAAPEWQRPFATLRLQRAQHLGMGHPGAP
ncbi:MAG: ferrochelatase [Candidatus Sericytochromatia bacterium]|nr:ferrochelatase [Candidatus Sericytochromatia bacterium]